jgi:hypothetical protein
LQVVTDEGEQGELYCKWQQIKENKGNYIASSIDKFAMCQMASAEHTRENKVITRSIYARC